MNLIKHRISRYSFDDLISGLNKEVEKKTVRKVINGDLSLYTYTVECNTDKSNWNVFTRMSRGLILNEKEQRIIALPFEKFFNYGESSYSLPDESFSISEKIDGSLGIVYYFNGWNVATKGSFNSEQARWAQSYLNKFNDLHVFDKNVTYLFEIIYHSNKIVIPYDFEGLVLLSAYDNVSGYEKSDDYLHQIADYFGFKRPKSYYHSIDELIKICKELPYDNEGFVVKFDSGLRIKIKGDEYCRVHRLISNVTPLGVWDMLRNNMDLNLVKKELPEEFHIDFENIVRILTNNLNEFINHVENEYVRTLNLSDKNLGLLLQEHKKELHQLCLPSLKYSKYVFAMRKNNWKEKIKEVGKTRDDLFKEIRPKANILEGYVPSNVMNRFQEEVV